MLASFARILSNGLLHASVSSPYIFEIYRPGTSTKIRLNWCFGNNMICKSCKEILCIFFEPSNLLVRDLPVLLQNIDIMSQCKTKIHIRLMKVMLNILILIRSTVLTALLITLLKMNLPQKLLKISSIVSTKKGTIVQFVWNHRRNLLNFLATSKKKVRLRE